MISLTREKLMIFKYKIVAHTITAENTGESRKKSAITIVV